MTLCLGLVIRPRPGRMAEAVAAVRELGDVTLGEAQEHGLPACAFTEKGADEALLARLEALAPVLGVEVVYAQTLVEQPAR